MSHLKPFVSLTAVLVLLIASAAKASQEAQELVVSTTQELLRIFKENPQKVAEDQTFVDNVINEKIVPHVDFEAMTKLAVATHWREASPEQRDALIKQFKTLLLRTYSKSIRQYGGEEIVFLPYRPNERADRAVVQSEFHTKEGQTIGVIYKLRKTDTWKIYDIAIDGISLVTNYRSSFDTEIQKAGIDGLIASLRDKNQLRAEQ